MKIYEFNVLVKSDEESPFQFQSLILLMMILGICVIIILSYGISNLLSDKRERHVAKASKYQGKKVIIVGGGAAGIKIAHNLAKEGVEFVLLEQTYRKGGEIESFEFGDQIVEGGVDHVLLDGLEEHEEANPLWHLAKSVDLQGTLSEHLVVKDINISADMGNNITSKEGDFIEKLC